MKFSCRFLAKEKQVDLASPEDVFFQITLHVRTFMINVGEWTEVKQQGRSTMDVM